MNIKFKKLHPEARSPHIATLGDAGCDLFAVEAATLAPGERGHVRTGIAMEIPLGYVGLVWDKSSVSHKGGIKTIGGVIDSGYRGEILIGVLNTASEPYTFEVGNKVAQILIQKVEAPNFEEADELSDSERGQGGWGSTGT